ncbi:MAG: hypothetical protein IPJ02_02880 [Chitinophagaceae bacterium]|nr:hypothetical protein [Chitinophagaceae bacterium]
MRLFFTKPTVPVMLRSGTISLCLLMTVSFLLKPGVISAQPFVDIINIKYSNSPNTGLLNKTGNDVVLQYFSLGTNLPVQFKNRKDAIIFSPYFEKWWSKINSNTQQRYSGIALPVSLIKSIPGSRWGVLLSVIARMNDSSISNKTGMQIGGAFIVNYKRNENLTWKLGTYVNNELFGVFVMPLAGIDWKINSRSNLFGVLPGNLTYEHKINDHFITEPASGPSQIRMGRKPATGALTRTSWDFTWIRT